jgi:hypothetical protein
VAYRKIQATKNYRLFTRSDGENRPLNLKKHKRLYDSMKLYGFLASFPIVCVRDANGNLRVKDGQHRLAIAEELGLTVFWTEEKTEFDPAITSTASEKWNLKDHALKHAANGITQYREGLDFAEQHGLPIGTAFALLAGTTSFNNVQNQFIDGTFKIKDRQWADAVAGIYGPMVALSGDLRTAIFVAACMRVCRVDEFDAKRLLRNAARIRERLAAYSTLEANLDMLEEVYNFSAKNLVGLKTAAMMAMRERSAVRKAKRKKAEKKDEKKDGAA